VNGSWQRTDLAVESPEVDAHDGHDGCRRKKPFLTDFTCSPAFHQIRENGLERPPRQKTKVAPALKPRAHGDDPHRGPEYALSRPDDDRGQPNVVPVLRRFVVGRNPASPFLQLCLQPVRPPWPPPVLPRPAPPRAAPGPERPRDSRTAQKVNKGRPARLLPRSPSASRPRQHVSGSCCS